MKKSEFLEKRIALLSELLKIDNNKYKLTYDENNLYGGYNLVIIKNKGGAEINANFKFERLKYTQFLDYINGMIASIEFLEHYKNYQIR